MLTHCAHFVRVYLSGWCQPTTVWLSMFMLSMRFLGGAAVKFHQLTH